MIFTTGVPNAPVVCRHDLREFVLDKDVVNLYVLAIDQMMKIKQEDPSSWFQLAAIHGRPYIPFDGVGQKGVFGGYCTHSSILFPSWHRPYLALFEQSISKHVHEIAREYKHHEDRERYLKAAARFRIPYWDWASEATLPGLIATQETIEVHFPNGNTGNMKNPLFAYGFHPVYSDFGDGLPDEKTWEAWQETYRYPTTTDAKARSEPALMQTTLNNNRLTLRNRAYNILTQIKDYNTFSHDSSGGTDQNPAGFDSIEAIHNQIHGLAGRNGHMGVVDYAAFDPVFWLHHANVDRLFALWQVLHPDVYVTPLKSQTGTFTRNVGEIETVDSPLTPFRRTADTFWNSAQVRDTRVFNYTYPEIERIQHLSKEEKIVMLTQEVNRLYGATAPVGAAIPSVFKDIPAPTGVVSGILTAVQGVVTGAGIAAQGAVGGAGQIVGGVLGGTGVAVGETIKGAGGVVHGVGGVLTGKQTVGDVVFGVGTAATGVVGGAGKIVGGVLGGTGQIVGGALTGADTASTGVLKGVTGVISGLTGVGVKAAVGPEHTAEAHQPTPIPQPTHVPVQHSNPADKSEYNEWIANIVVEKYAVKSTFFVHVFMGDVPADSTKWATEPNLVGSHVIFANNADFTGCQRCRSAHEARKLVTGTIPLTNCLVLRLGGIAKLDPAAVLPYLKQNLHWRVERHDKTPIDNKDVPGLKVTVGHSVVTVPQAAGEFPTWGPVQMHDEPTAGRVGGA